MDLANRLTPGARHNVIHGNAVALDPGRGVLILGQSGSGKSALSLQLMSMGARLVADDRAMLELQGGSLTAHAPDAIKGRIEARGIGILTATFLDMCKITLVVNLDKVATSRLPDPQQAFYHDVAIPLISAVQHAYFAPAILQILKTQDPS